LCPIDFRQATGAELGQQFRPRLRLLALFFFPLLRCLCLLLLVRPFHRFLSLGLQLLRRFRWTPADKELRNLLRRFKRGAKEATGGLLTSKRL